MLAIISTWIAERNCADKENGNTMVLCKNKVLFGKCNQANNKKHQFGKPKYLIMSHDDVIKWKHFPRYWPFVRGIHGFPVYSPHKGQCHRALMFSLICVWINGWVNNHETGDLRRYRAHYDVTVMIYMYEIKNNEILTPHCAKLTGQLSFKSYF